MDLYKEPPAMKLLVVLLAEIPNFLLNRRTPCHLSPALKGNNQQSVPGVSSNSFSTDISGKGKVPPGVLPSAASTAEIRYQCVVILKTGSDRI